MAKRTEAASPRFIILPTRGLHADSTTSSPSLATFLRQFEEVRVSKAMAYPNEMFHAKINCGTRIAPPASLGYRGQLVCA